MILIVEVVYLMSTLSQVGLGFLSIAGGLGVIVFNYKTREENDPEW